MYAQLVDAFGDLAEVQEKRAAIGLEVKNANLVQQAGDADPELVAKWGQVELPTLTPVGDFGAFLERLAHGTFDANVREQGEPNPLDVLGGLLPDLRGKRRTCTVGIRSGPEQVVAGLREAGFGFGVPGLAGWR